VAGTHWQIDRFDLIYYNPRHKRWQFFAEDPASNEDTPRDPHEGLHRYLIRALLNTFRNAVAETVGIAGEFRLASPASSGPNSDLTLEHPKSPVWDKYKDVFLDYLVSTAWYDGVPDPHRQSLQKWFKNSDIRMSRAEGLTFLSLLPILEDWDTWGCFIRARKGKRNATETFPPSCAKDWAEPFYIADLDFSDTRNRRALSKRLLGYPVQIEGLCLNLAEPIPSVHRAPKADFFDARFCRTPAGEEQTTYSLYAALVDEIMKKLTAEEGPLRQFIVAYPVAAAGRLHFLQIALRHSGHGHSCVDCLWNSWQRAHRSLWTPEFRDFLQEEMHRITTAAFQGEVYAQLAGSIKDHGENPDADACQAELCAHLYHLFPVDSVWQESVRRRYEKYMFPDSGESTRLLVGSRWTSKHHSRVPNRRDHIKIDGIRIKPADTPRDRIAKLAREHRIRQAIRQEQHFLAWLPNGLEAAKDAAANDRSSAYAIVMEWAKKNSPQAVHSTEVLDTPIATNLVQPTGREPYFARNSPNSLRRYLAEAFPLRTVPTDKLLLDALKSIMQPSILLQLSDLFDTGPAKIMSHANWQHHFASDDIGTLGSLWETFYSPLSNEVRSRIAGMPTLGGACRNELVDNMIAAVRARLTGCETLRNFYDQSFRENIHEPSRVESICGAFAADAFRAYCLDPAVVLQSCFAVLAHDERFGETALYQRKLSPVGHPHQQKLGKPVQQVDYYLSCSAKAAISPVAFSNGELCQHWANGPREIGNLLLHSGESTYLWTPQGFVENEHLHRQLICDAIADVSPDFTRTALVIHLQLWRTVESDHHRSLWSDVNRGRQECSRAQFANRR
jgi:hypothetical protein